MLTAIRIQTIALAVVGLVMIVVRQRAGAASDRARRAMWPQNERHKPISYSGVNGVRDAGVVLFAGGVGLVIFGLLY